MYSAVFNGKTLKYSQNVCQIESTVYPNTCANSFHCTFVESLVAFTRSGSNIWKRRTGSWVGISHAR